MAIVVESLNLTSLRLRVDLTEPLAQVAIVIESLDLTSLRLRVIVIESHEPLAQVANVIFNTEEDYHFGKWRRIKTRD